METLVATVRMLKEKLARLEVGPACPGDWLRLEAAVVRAAIAARQSVVGDAVDCDVLGDLMDELRYIKLCAEGHSVLGSSRA